MNRAAMAFQNHIMPTEKLFVNPEFEGVTEWRVA